MSKALLFAPLAAALFFEDKGLFRSQFPVLYEIAAFSSFPGLLKAHGVVLLINFVLSGLVIIKLGVDVGKARKFYRELAIKDGEKDAEARFSYPNLYAEGNSPNAKLFNCVQRGHQQALETYTIFLVLSLISSIRFPIATAFSGFIWIVARNAWAKSYAKGDPNQRYESFFAFGIWLSLISLLIGALGSIYIFFA